MAQFKKIFYVIIGLSLLSLVYLAFNLVALYGTGKPLIDFERFFGPQPQESYSVQTDKGFLLTPIHHHSLHFCALPHNTVVTIIKREGSYAFLHIDDIDPTGFITRCPKNTVLKKDISFLAQHTVIFDKNI